MTIDKLHPGLVVYDVGKTKLGNTSIRTTSVWSVHIVSVNKEKKTVEARWNNNPPQIFPQRRWSKWRLQRPILIPSGFGGYRLANKAEIAAIKKKA